MNLDAVNLNALYLVKLIFGKYFCYFDLNRVIASLQLHLYLDANCVPVGERVNEDLINFYFSMLVVACDRHTRNCITS